MTTPDFSKPETRALYQAEVAKRVELGMSREEAEMLVAALMWEGTDRINKSTQFAADVVPYIR
jgi:hypothetical protein